ncbi:hypothetical protein BGZ54_004297, partial [Gamsiella multidivaricata]
MPKQLSMEEKGIIVGMSLAGLSHAEIATKRNTPKSTVTNIIHIYHQRGTAAHAPISGRPRALSERDIRSMIRNTKREGRVTLQDITTM